MCIYIYIERERDVYVHDRALEGFAELSDAISRCIAWFAKSLEPLVLVVSSCPTFKQRTDEDQVLFKGN